MDLSYRNKSKKRLLKRMAFFLTQLLIYPTFFLSSCSSLVDFETSQEFHSHVVGVVKAETSIGQTFTSRRSGFNGIQLWLKVVESHSSRNGIVQLELYNTKNLENPLESQEITFKKIQADFPISISFPAQNTPPDQEYYLKLTTSDGFVQVFGRAENNYSKGHALENDKSIDSDIGFRLMYSYNFESILADINQNLTNIHLIIPLLLVLWLPGNLLLSTARWLHSTKDRLKFDWGEQTAISIGLSIATISLILLWTTALGISIEREDVILFFSILSLLFVINLIFRIRYDKREKKFSNLNPTPQSIALIMIFLLSIAVRLIMIRDMAGPAWVDSVHHAVITRLIVENGQIPSSYLPYIETATSSYHPGFHVNLAAVHFLTGLNIPEAMLLFGQVLNALCIFAAYLFTSTITKDRTASVIAALIVGLVTPMPAYYTSWGRYTQLAGLLVLPVSYALLINFIENGFNNGFWKSVYKRIHTSIDLFLLACVASAGLLLTHYRVFAFLLFLLTSYFLTKLILTIRDSYHWKHFMIAITLVVAVFLLTLLFIITWWTGLFGSMIIPRLDSVGTKSAPFADFNWNYLTSALGIYTLIAGSAGLVTSLIQKRFFSIQMVIWISLLFLSANLGFFALPGKEFINNTSVEIMLFLPISVFCGYILSWILNKIIWYFPNRWRLIYWISLLALIIVITNFGVVNLIAILNPSTMLLREADYDAMDWIQLNVPQDETILINSFFWGYGLYAGGDGGFWITPLTGRKTTPQPVLVGMGENAAISQRETEINRKVNYLKDNTEDLYRYLSKQGINYIYLGSKGGALSPELLKDSPLFELIYSHNDTWIFKIKPLAQSLGFNIEHVSNSSVNAK